MTTMLWPTRDRGRLIVVRLLFWLALFSPTLLVLWRSGSAGRGWQSLLWAALACLLLAALPRRAFVLVLWLTLLASPALLWWLGYASLNGVGPGWEAAAAALSTDFGEAWAAFRLVSAIPGFLGFAGASAFFLLASVAVLYRGRGTASPQDIPAGALKGVLAAALMPFAASSMIAVSSFPVPPLFQISDASFSPVGTAARLLMGGIDRILYGNLLDADGGRRAGTATRTITEASLAVFVVGESVRVGAIGPQKAERGPWTKALDERMRAGLGVWLPATCAGSHGTHLAVPLLLTGTLPERQSEAATAPSVLSRLKAAGFATAWISNQDPSVFKEAGHDLYWSVSRAASFRNTFDEAMVPVVAAFAAPLMAPDADAARQPRAALLHMMGSHFDYADRYPSLLFPEEPGGLSPESRVELRYERSVEYSAKVLAALAAMLDQSPQPAFLVFSGDHGENLPSDRNGLLTHLGPRASRQDGRTTSLVLWNKAMLASGRTQALAPLLAAEIVSHADVANAFLVLADVLPGPVVPVPQPRILAPVRLHGPVLANACADLEP